MAEIIGRVGWKNYVSVAPTTSSITTSGLVLNLDASNPLSYSGTGTTWTDLSGNGNNGTLTNGTSYSSANGGTLVFDGINDYVDTNLVTNQSAFTYCVWAKSSARFVANRVMGNADSISGNNGADIIWGALSYNSIYSVRRGGGNFDITTGEITNFSGNWHYIVLTYDNVNGSKLYCDNTLVGSKSTIGLTSTLTLRIGKDGNGNDAFNGSVGAVQVYNKALSSTEIKQNFDATKSRFGFVTYTARTSAFAAATGITDTTILNALNTFDTGLISNGLDTKMKALYPFVGGTAVTHKYNFMDARDADAAFRLAFNGGWVHSSTGAKPNGTNAYADTKLNPNANISLNSVHLSYYSRTIATGLQSEIGSYTSVNDTGTFLSYNYSGGNYKGLNAASTSVGTQFSPSTGFLLGSRINSTTEKYYWKGTLTDTLSKPSKLLITSNMYVGAHNVNSSPYNYSTKESAFASIGDGLSDSESSTLYTLVQAFQTALSRQV